LLLLLRNQSGDEGRKRKVGRGKNVVKIGKMRNLCLKNN
jgi:hypothetical protein